MELIQIQNETTNENQKPLYDRINFIEKLSLMEGDEIPVSAFMKNIDGRFELGGSAYEKRGIAEFVPEWDKNKCIQCTMCSLVCSHATIRPFLLSNEEVQNVPMNTKLIPAKNQKLSIHNFCFSVRLQWMWCLCGNLSCWCNSNGSTGKSKRYAKCF